MINLGFIHGRFQPFHNDHLKYVQAGFERCRHLVVGISNPDPILSAEEGSDPGRIDPFKNPFTYFERLEMVRSSLREKGVYDSQFTIVPFPVSFPELYKFYIPEAAVFFMTIYDAWGRHKKKMFEDAGRTVDVMWERPLKDKGLSASEVRKSMAVGAAWQYMVPEGVADVILRVGGEARVRKLASKIE